VQDLGYCDCVAEKVSGQQQIEGARSSDFRDFSLQLNEQRRELICVRPLPASGVMQLQREDAIDEPRSQMYEQLRERPWQFQCADEYHGLVLLRFA
jgi:hypothetical protein